MKLGTNDINSVYLGTNAVSAVYLGTNLVWSGMDADYKAILDYATTQGYTLPSASQQLLQEQLVIDLKDAGIWSKLDIFYVFATDGDSDFASINWKDPSNFEITEVNSPTFTTNVGFEGDGTSAYLDTNWVLNTDTVNYEKDNAGLFIGCPIMTSTTNRDCLTGASNGYNNAIEITGDSLFSSNRTRMNSTSRIDSVWDSKRDDMIYFANISGGSNVYTRNTDLSTSTTFTASGTEASSGFPALSQLILRGPATGYVQSGIKIGVAGFGTNWSSTEMDDICTAWYTNYFSNL
jgi:hypothetical protein